MTRPALLERYVAAIVNLALPLTGRPSLVPTWLSLAMGAVCALSAVVTYRTWKTSNERGRS